MRTVLADYSRPQTLVGALAGTDREEYTRVLVGAGLPEPLAAVVADSDLGIARGEVYTDSGDLRKLIGHPTTSLAEAIQVAIRA